LYRRKVIHYLFFSIKKYEIWIHPLIYQSQVNYTSAENSNRKDAKNAEVTQRKNLGSVKHVMLLVEIAKKGNCDELSWLFLSWQ
jgi:hypothetical protein